MFASYILIYYRSSYISHRQLLVINMQDQDQDNDGGVQQRQERESPILADENPRNRPRYNLDDDHDVRIITPLNPALNWSTMTANANPIGLATLMGKDHASIPQRTRIDLQLLLVIINANTGSNQGLEFMGRLVRIEEFPVL